jgi:hypothetical protein
MNTSPYPIDALTVPGELNAIPWTDSEGKREFSRQLEEALMANALLFQDKVPLTVLPGLSKGSD